LTLDSTSVGGWGQGSSVFQDSFCYIFPAPVRRSNCTTVSHGIKSTPHVDNSRPKRHGFPSRHWKNPSSTPFGLITRLACSLLANLHYLIKSLDPSDRRDRNCNCLCIAISFAPFVEFNKGYSNGTSSLVKSPRGKETRFNLPIKISSFHNCQCNLGTHF
jgi:hypothetical protein